MNEADKWPKNLTVPIGGVPSERIGAVWERVLPLLHRVIKPMTGYSTSALYSELISGLSQLWVIGDFQAIVVTSVQQRPLHKILWVQFLAGSKLGHWLDDWITVMEAFAKAHDCVAIEFSGRPGWNWIQKQHPDYRAVSTTFRKEL